MELIDYKPKLNAQFFHDPFIPGFEGNYVLALDYSDMRKGLNEYNAPAYWKYCAVGIDCETYDSMSREQCADFMEHEWNKAYEAMKPYIEMN